MFIHPQMTSSKIIVAFEFAVLFLVVPLVLYFHATRWNVHVGLWLVALYAVTFLWHDHDFSWRYLWHGKSWPLAQRKIAALRFLIATPLVIFLTAILAPERMFSFPLQRPWFWLLVMVLYPVLSVIPQELLFRSFFFRRYRALFPAPWALILASAFCFGFVHVVFHNFISPTLCLIGGMMFSYSYNQHRSLKWAVVEHAAYGCMVFTVGIGFYFLVGGVRL